MTRRRKLAFLALLYAAQGMPFGFQAMALPLHLREAGASLSMIGFAGVLAAPWMLKALWAPLIERVGRRRPVVVVTQLALIALCGVAALSPPSAGLAQLGLVILLMNLVTATQDVAVDAIAVDLLGPDELGPGNAAQVGGYKVGMLLAGGVGVVLAGALGWAWGFALMAAVAGAALLAVLAWREPPPTPRAAQARRSYGAILRALVEVVRLPGQVGLLVVVATYKVGESISDGMWKQYLLGDHGKEAIGLWVNTVGMAPSILGSLAGGWWMARGGPTARALGGIAAVRAITIVAFAVIAVLGTTSWPVLVAASWAEDLAGGALTTAMFAFMMAQVDRRIGATHYAVLASVEVLGKTPGSLLSGVVAQHLGFAACFGLAATLSVAYLPLVWAVHAAAQRAATPR